MEKTLKMVFTMENGKDRSYGIAEPKEGLTGEMVRSVMEDMLDREVILAGGGFARAVKKAYVRSVDKEVLFAQ